MTKYFYLLLSLFFFSSPAYALGGITGSLSICTGASVILHDSTAGGAWSSSATSVAIIGPVTGVLTGVSAGTSIITYTAGSSSVTAVATVNAYVSPAVSISLSTADTVCAGTLVTFSADPVYGGAAPTYEWKLNDSAAGTGGSYIAYPGPGDVISVVMTSNAACTRPDTAVGTITLTVLPALIPAITIAAVPGFVIGMGESDTLIAVDTTGVSMSVSYQWIIGSTPVTGANSATYVTDSLANGDSVTCVVTSVGPCGGHSTFNSVPITVGPSGVKQPGYGGDIALFPNPNNGVFTIKGFAGAAIDGEVFIEVTDMVGRPVYKSKAEAKGGIVNEQVALRNLPGGGVYLLNMLTASGRQVFSFVVE
jgi:hypothetical protein